MNLRVAVALPARNSQFANWRMNEPGPFPVHLHLFIYCITGHVPARNPSSCLHPRSPISRISPWRKSPCPEPGVIKADNGQILDVVFSSHVWLPKDMCTYSQLWLYVVCVILYYSYRQSTKPICSMYTYIYLHEWAICWVNVGKYSIHGAHGKHYPMWSWKIMEKHLIL